MYESEINDSDNIDPNQSGGACSWEGVYEANRVPLSHEKIPRSKDSYVKPQTPDERARNVTAVNLLTIGGGISDERALRRIMRKYNLTNI